MAAPLAATIAVSPPGDLAARECPGDVVSRDHLVHGALSLKGLCIVYTPHYTNATYRIPSALLFWWILVANPGCATLGPTSLPGDRFNYNKSLARSSNEQLLLNIVRLRYGEPLHWLETSSMLSQYSLEASVNANKWWNNLDVWRSPALRAVYGVDGDPSKQAGWDAGVSYADRPTISYAPVQGEAFARRLLSPIPISVVFFFVQAGWPVDEVLQLCVDRMNGLPNALSTMPAAVQNETGEAEKFERALELLRDVQRAGRIQGAIERSADTEELVWVLDPVSRGEYAEQLSALLGIDKNANRIRLTPRGHALDADELALQTRSLLGTLQILARCVEVPEEHARDQMILEWQGSDRGEEWLSIQQSSRPRQDTFVQIRHKGHWFYIADSDVHSKRTFGLLTYLYSLQASDVTGRGPLLTVPASR